ncbi:MAG: NFACT family protein [Deltaproteobacteria bacterium]|nr:NFACT family protein [Candidatus Anaeroferrophillacea bacterium]
MDRDTLTAMIDDLRPLALGAFINKVQQPGPRHLVLRLRGRAGNLKLMVSCDPRAPGLHLTTGMFPNPPRPPRFCAYLRRHLQGARISAIEQPHHDRVVIIRARRGDGEPLALVCEFFGTAANAAFARGPETVIEELLTPRAGHDRLVAGRPYIPPAKATAMPSASATDVRTATPTDAPMAMPAPRDTPTAGNLKAPTDEMSGGLAARGPDAPPSGICPGTGLAPPAGAGAVDAPSGTIPAVHRRYDRRFIPRFFAHAGPAPQSEVVAALDRHCKRLTKRLENIGTEEREKQADQEAEQLGELLKSALDRIRRGDKSVTVPNWWSETQEPVTVPLDPALSPVENLKNLYKRAKKARRGLEMIAERRRQTEEELAYYEDLRYQTEGEPDPELLAEIAALVPARRGSQDTGTERPAAGGKEKKTDQPAGITVISLPDGTRLLLGRSARGNDRLCRHAGHGDDLWFHARGIPGAHVVLQPSPGRAPTEAEIERAARLAAWHSRGRNDSRVNVTCLPLKHLRKPKGGKPGQVLIAGPERTLTVVPAED